MSCLWITDTLLRCEFNHPEHAESVAAKQMVLALHPVFDRDCIRCLTGMLPEDSKVPATATAAMTAAAVHGSGSRGSQPPRTTSGGGVQALAQLHAPGNCTKKATRHRTNHSNADRKGVVSCTDACSSNP